MDTNLPQIKVADIQAVVAARYGLSVEQLTGPRRLRRMARPRQIAVYFARTMTHHSLPAIGRMFGGRDHTTILFSCRRTKERMDAHPIMELEILHIERKLIERAEGRLAANTVARMALLAPQAFARIEAGV